jgi:hypothetical protein
MQTGESRYGDGDLLSVPARRNDGATISIEFTIVPLKDEAGHMVGMAAIMRDVTEMFEEMRSLKRKLAGAAEGSRRANAFNELPNGQNPRSIRSGMIRSKDCPIALAARWPKMRSAPGFQKRITPSRRNCFQTRSAATIASARVERSAFCGFPTRGVRSLIYELRISSINRKRQENAVSF